MIGTSVSHYLIREELGRGGMGIVYRAEDTKLKRTVALKFLSSGGIVSDEDRRRFDREAETVSSLNHPNIATIHDIDEVGGQRFLVFEFIPGGTLRSRIPEQGGTPLPVETVVEYGLQMAEALAHAHRHNVVHRDIKPDNMMLTEDGEVKITDFGVSMLRGGTRLTRDGSTVGTAAYMSPEQIQGEEVDHRSDLFSLGVTLYELLSGKLPFRGEHEAAIMYSIVNEDPQPLSVYRSDIPDEMTALIRRCLEKDRAGRIPTADEIAAGLKQLKRGGTGRVEQGVRVRRPAHSWAWGAGAVLVGVLLLYFLIPRSEEVRPAGRIIGVLPFVNMSGNPEDEYFSDGMMEDVLAQLTRVGDLSVISRTTMMRYKGSGKSVREIAAELNAGVLLEGSVRRDGNRLKVVANLIDPATEGSLWGGTYDRMAGDVFSVQGEIALNIAVALQARMTEAERTMLGNPRISNPDAYDLLLLGRYEVRQLNEEGLLKGIALFQEALNIDPDDARIWAALASARTVQADAGYIATEEGYTQARLAAARAIALDDQLADGHIVMGWVNLAHDWDWNAAALEYRKATQIEPGNAGVVRQRATLAATLGNFEEAVALARRSVELSPAGMVGYLYLGQYLLRSGDPDEALQVLAHGLYLNPGSPYLHYLRGSAFLFQHRLDSAFAEFEWEPEESWRSYGLTSALYLSGRTPEADSALGECIRRFGDIGACQIAEIYSLTGNADSAFAWLDRAYTMKDGGLLDMKGNLFFRNIERDARYRSFMLKLRLPV